jgi:hypothetical protein
MRKPAEDAALQISRESLRRHKYLLWLPPTLQRVVYSVDDVSSFFSRGGTFFQCEIIDPMEDLIINTVLSEFVDFENVV